MSKSIILVTDVKVEVRPFHGDRVRIASIKTPSIVPSELDTVDTDIYDAKVHEFRGGPYGREGIKVAFGPKVESKLGLPLRLLDEERYRQEDMILHLEMVNERLDGALHRYENATFWQRLKWAVSGGDI